MPASVLSEAERESLRRHFEAQRAAENPPGPAGPPPAVRAFAPPRTRRTPRIIEQVKIAFPVNCGAQYRWGWENGATTEWRDAPVNDILRAPPDATGIEWREKPAKPQV